MFGWKQKEKKKKQEFLSVKKKERDESEQILITMKYNENLKNIWILTTIAALWKACFQIFSVTNLLKNVQVLCTQGGEWGLGNSVTHCRNLVHPKAETTQPCLGISILIILPGGLEAENCAEILHMGKLKEIAFP